MGVSACAPEPVFYDLAISTTDEGTALAAVAASPPTRSSTPAPGRRFRRTTWDLFLQFFAVMLGVTAATVVTSWREQRSLRETETRALQGIANEVAINRERLTWRRDYYRKVAAEIAALRVEKGSEASLSDLKTFRGLNPIILRASSFQIGLQTQAPGRFDSALAEDIADLYALQEWVLSGVSKWMDYIVQHSEGMLLPPLQVEMIMGDWASMCGELIEAYTQLQPQLPPPLPAG